MDDAESAPSGSTPQDLFDLLVDQIGGQPGITGPSDRASRGFGSSALKVDGSIFAMLSGGGLVVKLPRSRVAALIQAGVGTPFDAGKGTPMKEWLAVEGEDRDTWFGLASESLNFVSRRPP
jgi:hypothetical protein